MTGCQCLEPSCSFGLDYHVYICQFWQLSHILLIKIHIRHFENNVVDLSILFCTMNRTTNPKIHLLVTSLVTSTVDHSMKSKFKQYNIHNDILFTQELNIKFYLSIYTMQPFTTLWASTMLEDYYIHIRVHIHNIWGI